MKPVLRRGSLTVNGVTLSYLERMVASPADTAPIVLLHGLIATGETLSSLLAELPGDLRIFALDLPGAGFSERSDAADVSFAGMARLVKSFLAAMELEKPILLGHSHGGAVALRLAAGNPEAVQALVLLAPAHPFSGRERAVVRFYLSWLGERVARLLPSLPASVHAIAFRQMAGPGVRCDRSVLELYRQSGKVPGTIDHLLRLLKTWEADMDSLRSLLMARPIELPTLLLWGDHDRVVPESSAPALERCLTQHEHVTLRGVGHLPNEERPQECGSLIRTWLIWLDTLPKYAAWRAELASNAKAV